MENVIYYDPNEFLGIAKSIFEQLGIAYGNVSYIYLNGRLTSTYGKARKRGDIFEIQVAKRIADTRLDKGIILSTVLHELLHTVDGCFNHGSKFQRLARKITEYTGIYIGTYASQEESKAVNEYYPKSRREYRYEVVCPDCGVIGRYKTKSRAVKKIDSGYHGYSCGKCGNHDLYIRELF